MTRRTIVILGFLLIAAGAVPAAFLFSGSDPAQQTTLPVYGVDIVKQYPHDPKAFSQGLVVKGGILLEGTGQLGESTLREVDLKTGRVIRRVRLSDKVFGEGVTVLKDKIYQLTWEHHIGYVYDRKSMRYERTFRYSGEGWGLTNNGTHLIMSDGTPTLRFIDPKTFRVVKRLKVRRDGNREVADLNELEMVNGEIFANIWHSGFVARIDPKTGRVKSWLDLRPLKPAAVQFDNEAVWNGIAWDPKSKRLFVTGKDWPILYEIRIHDQPGQPTKGRK